jgi:predicted RecA/RadA family phage recombinase
MAKNFVQDGNIVDLTNGTGAAVSSGQPFAVGSLVVVAQRDLAAGERGPCALEGVWELPKAASTVFAEGDKAFLSSSGNLNTTDTNPLAGYVVRSAGSGAAFVRVKLARA